MNLAEIRKLLRLFNNSGLSEMEVERDGARLLLKKAPATAGAQTQPVADASLVSVPAPTATPTPPVQPSAPIQSANHIIKAPMVGTFYRTPAPTSPSFVEEGDVARKGQTLCIIEAMKLMNEIECDINGRVLTIYPENGKPVEFGEPLFEIEPS